MKVELLRIIQNALIGGRNGEMAFIYNSPLVRELYDEYVCDNCENEKFICFLKESLPEIEEKKSCNNCKHGHNGLYKCRKPEMYMIDEFSINMPIDFYCCYHEYNQ